MQLFCLYASKNCQTGKEVLQPNNLLISRFLTLKMFIEMYLIHTSLSTHQKIVKTKSREISVINGPAKQTRRKFKKEKKLQLTHSDIFVQQYVYYFA